MRINAVASILLSSALAGALIGGCARFRVRPDPFPSPLDTGLHSLLIEGCGQMGSVIGCFIEPETRAIPLRIHSPLGGTLTVMGCAETRLTLARGGEHSVILTDTWPEFCVVDLVVLWAAPEGLTEPIRGLRGRVYVRVRPSASAPARVSVDGGEAQLGMAVSMGAPKTISLKFSRAVAHGKFRLFGCGAGVPLAEFSGDTVTLDGALFNKECTYFGWATAPDLDDEFTLGVTVPAPGAVKLAARAWRDKERVCFEAERFTTLVVAGARYTNRLRGCLPAARVVSFYTTQGRATHGIFDNAGGVRWIP